MSIGSSFDTLPRASFGHTTHDSSDHLVQFYEDDSFLADTVARVVGDSLEAGDGAVIIGTGLHREAIEQRLRVRGLDLDETLMQRRFVSLDAGETLAKLLVDEYPDASRFEEVIGGTISRTTIASPHRYVRAFGEMVALLWADGKRDAALRLEALWNNLATRHRFSLLCAYPLNGFSGSLDGQLLAKVCAEHSHVIPAESYSALTDSNQRQLTITHLQRKAQLLENEMAVRAQVENELRYKIAELAEADRRKNEFLAMLGHELRNPLSAVLNAITAADLDEAHRDCAIEIVRRQSVQLARMVDDLLDVARITQGRVALRKESIAIVSIVERSLEETRSAADKCQQRLIAILPPETRTMMVDADPTRIQQSISNLIHNAIKFTPDHGRIEVALRRRGSEVAIRIRDSGVGIAPEMLPRVFDLFTQGDIALDRAQGGLGIGLTLVKQLIAMHGGRVEARSEGLGLGSEFEISLPLVSDHRQKTPTDPKPTARGSLRVLVVEDNADGAEAMRMLLELLGHEVRVASDGFIALDILAETTFDAILVDIGLPAMDGYTLATHIRALPGADAILLVALTGYGQDEDRRRALAAGFDQHLVKPVNIDRLQALLTETSTSVR